MDSIRDVWRETKRKDGLLLKIKVYVCWRGVGLGETYNYVEQKIDGEKQK